MQRLIWLALLLVSLIPAWLINKWLQGLIRPRASFGRFLLYMIVCLLLVFLYTFLLMLLILRFFPPVK
jgi:hypothetical protein